MQELERYDNREQKSMDMEKTTETDVKPASALGLE